MLALRDHPQMNYYGFRSWPPVWVNIRENPTKRLTGEIGRLIGIIFYPGIPKCLYLRMQVENERYMGCLAFSDASFCRQMEGILKNHIGRSMKEIGDLDLSGTM